MQLLADSLLLGWVVFLARRPDQNFDIGWIKPPVWQDLGYTLVNFTVGYTAPLFPLYGLALEICRGPAINGLRARW